MCRARDPHFSPKFVPCERPPFQPQISAPEHIIFTNDKNILLRSITIWHFCSSGDHHFQNLFLFKPFIAAHGRLTAASPNAKQRPRVSGWPECQPDTSYKSVPETPTITLELAPEPRIFTLEPLRSPPIFHFAVAHTYQNLGRVPPPPPPGWLSDPNHPLNKEIEKERRTGVGGK